ncbi:MAG: hypothetical protein KQI35_03005 [Bacteroidetes bacterium]|nr:hypothetical protein [Bacteroidota bacterium]
MKKVIINLAILFVITITTVSAQLPPHPNGGVSPTAGNTPVGGGASIGGGLIILISLGMGYAMKKIYSLRSDNREKILN